MTPLSLFARDDGDVDSADSHMTLHDCGQERKQRCCEMKPSSCWGNWDRKWGSAWGHDVQTQQSEDFVFPTIPYSPTCSCCHIRTHIQAHHASRSFIPWRWEHDISQSVPATPLTPTVAPPPILGAPSHSTSPVPERNDRQNNTHCSERWSGARKQGQRGGLSELRREKQHTKSCLLFGLTDTAIFKKPDTVNYRCADLKRWLVSFMF